MATLAAALTLAAASTLTAASALRAAALAAEAVDSWRMAVAEASASSCEILSARLAGDLATRNTRLHKTVSISNQREIKPV